MIDKAGYAKFPHPASRFALTGVFVAKTANGVRVAATGVGSSGAFRVTAMEQALAAGKLVASGTRALEFADVLPLVRQDPR